MKQNVIFILIDGCRADKIFDKDSTAKKPNIDLLIKNGISFTNVFSSVDGTTMSLNCLFNSLYPTKTGLRTKKVILTNKNFWPVDKDLYKANINFIEMPESSDQEKSIDINKTAPIEALRILDRLKKEVTAVARKLQIPHTHINSTLEEHSELICCNSNLEEDLTIFSAIVHFSFLLEMMLSIFLIRLLTSRNLFSDNYEPITQHRPVVATNLHKIFTPMLFQN